MHYYRVQRTDEGWSSIAYTWTLDDDTVISEIVADGRDCDGRLTEYGSFACPIDRLTSRESFDGWDATGKGLYGKIMLPDWIEINSSQYDEYAQAMNY